jgi:hypothetical protein
MKTGVTIPRPHKEQSQFIDGKAKRKVVRAGRRGGKTVGMAILAIEKFLDGRRILYAAPTQDQIDSFWSEVTKALAEPIRAGAYYKNETRHIIEVQGTENRIRAKTAWNADSLRGDYADVLILDEYQLMDETAWGEVGAPMLLDNNGDAIFIYTPPSLRTRSTTKARDPQHAAKLYKKAQEDDTGRWAVYHFTSHDNPHISKQALAEISKDMTSLAVRQEILAEDIDEAPGALWTRDIIELARVVKTPDNMSRVVIGVDPSTTSGGDEAGIITAGLKGEDYYTLADDSLQGSPEAWAQAAITAYHRYKADCIVAEKNNGGEMVESVIQQAVINARKTDSTIGEVPVRLVWASRGKATRAEPISAIAEKGRDHHVGVFEKLEDELCMWVPGQASPNRLDAKVWAMTYLTQRKTTFNPKATVTSYISGGDEKRKRPGF